MRAVIAIVKGLVAGCLVAGCGASDSGLVIELSSAVMPIDSIAITVLGDRGALIRDQLIRGGEGALALPRRVLIAGGEREERVRIFAWGLQDNVRTAFGHLAAELVAGEQVELSLRLEAPLVDCDGDGVPDLLDGCPAIADPAQQNADADGPTDACTPGAGCPANLITNAGFEDGLAGWVAPPTDPGVLSRISGGHTGAFAAEVCKEPSGTLATYSMDDRPDAQPSPPAGARYRADAWVRAAVPGAQMIEVRLGEFTVSGPISTSLGTLAASAEWQIVSAVHTIVGAPDSRLDLRIRVESAPDGACFQVDDVCLQELAPACP